MIDFIQNVQLVTIVKTAARCAHIRIMGTNVSKFVKRAANRKTAISKQDAMKAGIRKKHVMIWQKRDKVCSQILSQNNSWLERMCNNIFLFYNVEIFSTYRLAKRVIRKLIGDFNPI